MANTVQSPNEISLNSVYYKIAGPVKRTLLSYPEKQVIGDYTKDSNPILSTLALTDHRGGIGQDIMERQEDADRSWYSTADTRYKGHLILPPLVVNYANLPAGHSATRHLMFYKGTVYISSDATTNGIYAAGASALLKAFNSSPSPNWDVAIIAGTAYLIVGGSDRYLYFDGTTWTERTVGGTGGHMAAWDDRIWGINGKLWYTLAIGSGETFLNYATPFYLTASGGTGQLFVAKDASGDLTLHLATTIGLFIYDIANDKWYPTGLQVPDTSTYWTNRYALGVRWRDDIYYGIRSTVYKYSVRGNEAVIEDIGFGTGLGVDRGLPNTKGYIVAAMVASYNELIVALHGNGSLTSIILAWNGRGWRVLYEGGANLGELLDHMVIADVSGNMSLVFSNNTTSPYNVSYLRLSSDIYAPIPELAYTYAAAATHDWPWFTAGQSDVTKVAVRVKVETLHPTTSETVKVYYALNRSTTFQIMTNVGYPDGIIDGNPAGSPSDTGVTTFDFPSVDSYVSTTARTGKEFRSIQFRVVFARGDTTTNTPDVLGLTLEYYKKLTPKWQFQVDVDVNTDYKGRTPKEQHAALLTAQETATLQEFTYRDPASNSDATFYVQARPVQGAENTGFDERGTLSLQLVEV